MKGYEPVMHNIGDKPTCVVVHLCSSSKECISRYSISYENQVRPGCACEQHCDDMVQESVPIATCRCIKCPNCHAHEIENCYEHDRNRHKWVIRGYKVEDSSQCIACGCWFEGEVFHFEGT